MEVADLVQDNRYNVNINESNYPYYSVRPISSDGTKGIRSDAINYKFTNPVCYFKSFTGSIQDEGAKLQLVLSTVYKVKSFQILKGTTVIAEVINPETLIHDFLDVPLENGINSFVVELVLEDGSTIVSDAVVIDYVAKGTVFVINNALISGEDILIMKNPFDNLKIQIFNQVGMAVKSRNLPSDFVFIDTTGMPSGYYLYIITEEEKVIQEGKILIL